jgi:hypothetical protein
MQAKEKLQEAEPLIVAFTTVEVLYLNPSTTSIIPQPELSYIV